MDCPNCSDHNPHAAASDFFREEAFCDGPDEFTYQCGDCAKTWIFTKCTTCDGDGDERVICGDGCCSNCVTCRGCDGRGYDEVKNA